MLPRPAQDREWTAKEVRYPCMTPDNCENCGVTPLGYYANDYVQFWICPDCGHTWNRWSEDHPFFKHAESLRLGYDNYA